MAPLFYFNALNITNMLLETMALVWCVTQQLFHTFNKNYFQTLINQQKYILIFEFEFSVLFLLKFLNQLSNIEQTEEKKHFLFWASCEKLFVAISYTFNTQLLRNHRKHNVLIISLLKYIW